MPLKLIAGLSFFFLSNLVNAQVASFGLKAGINFATLRNSMDGMSYTSTDSRKTPHFGILGHFRISDRFALQPELVYSDQGVIRNLGFVDNRTKLHYLNLPVIAQIYVGKRKNFHLDVGGQLGYLTAARLKGVIGYIHDQDGHRYITTNEDTKALYATTDRALCLGFGLDVSRNFAVNTRWNYGLTNIDNSSPGAIQYRKQYGPLANKVVQVSIAYKFGKAAEEIQPGK